MKFIFATIAAFAVAVTAAETGICCPYVNSPDCSLKPPVEAECKPFTFNKCEKAPSRFVNYYFITTLKGDNIEYRRYNASDCNAASLEPKWSKDGALCACLGPVDKTMTFDAYIVVTKSNGTAITSTATPAATTTTATAAPVIPTSSSVVATTTPAGSAAGAIVPSAFVGIVAVASAMLF